ncbi:putative reverse transcriptase domain-containing protein, partial [Tanacetum coccineum]
IDWVAKDLLELLACTVFGLARFCAVLACAVFGMQGSVWYLHVPCFGMQGDVKEELFGCNSPQFLPFVGVVACDRLVSEAGYRELGLVEVENLDGGVEEPREGNDERNYTHVGASHAAYTDRFHELARLVPHLVTPESRVIERYVYGLAPQICGMVATTEPKTFTKAVTDFWCFMEIENTGTWPKCTICNSFHAPSGLCHICYNCNRPGHLARDYRSVPRNVNPVNARNPNVRACYECGSTDHIRLALPVGDIRAQDRGENRFPNQVAANNGGQGRGNLGNQARGMVFMLGAEEARQDLNIMTGTFTLNNHFSTTLFDSGADYGFVSTTFIPLLGLEPNDLGFRYEIEIASGQLVEIDKVIKGCKLEIEGHVFDIDLIPFGHGSLDVCDRLAKSLYRLTHSGIGELYDNQENSKSKVSSHPTRPVHRLGERGISSIKDRILAARKEVVDEFAGLQKGLDEMIEQRSDGTLYYLDRIWVPLKGEVRTLIMDKAHKSKYFVHPGADKMYYDLRDRYWWPRMKKDIAEYVINAKRLLGTSFRHGTELSPSGLMVRAERTSQIWKTCLEACVLGLQGKDSWEVHLLLVEFSYNNSYHSSVRCALFEACLIKDRLKVAHDHQKSYVVKRRKPLEFSVGEYVLLKVSPWKGVVCFRKKGKLAPRIWNWCSWNVLCVQTKKVWSDPTLKVPLDEIRVNAKLNFVEEPVEILEKEFKKLKRSRITIVKVRCNSKPGPEFMWEREDQMKLKYPHWFSNVSS